MAKYEFTLNNGNIMTIRAPNRRVAVQTFNNLMAEENRRILALNGIDPAEFGVPDPETEPVDTVRQQRRVKIRAPKADKDEDSGAKVSVTDDIPVEAAPSTQAFSTNTFFNQQASKLGVDGAITYAQLQLMLGSNSYESRGLIGQLGVSEGMSTPVINFGAGILPADNPALANAQMNKFVTHNEAMVGLVRASESKIREWQNDLIRAGFLDEDKVLPGIVDPYTMSAYSDFLDYALLRGGFQQVTGGTQTTDGKEKGTGSINTQLNTNLTWRELLDQRIRARDEALAAAEAREAAERGGSGGGASYITPDPLMVRSVANQVAQALLGRNLDESALGDLVERVNAGLASATGDDQDFDLQQNLAQWIRQASPVEAQAQDLANTYSTFTDLIGGVGQRAARGGEMNGITRT